MTEETFSAPLLYLKPHGAGRFLPYPEGREREPDGWPAEAVENPEKGSSVPEAAGSSPDGCGSQVQRE